MGVPATIITGATTLILQHTPIVLDRQADRGPGHSVAGPTLAGTIIVQTWPVARQRMLRLRIVLMSETEVGTLRTILDAGTIISVNLGGGSAIQCLPATDAEQNIYPLLTDYPEYDDAGTGLPSGRKVWAADVTLVRI